MATIPNPQTLPASTATTLINAGGSNSGPDGLQIIFTITGTNSLVLKKNTAPPGAAQSLSNIPYVNKSLAAQSAGTAVTASGIAYITPENAGFDIYATNTWTSGAVVVRATPSNLGASSGGGGTIPAADVTSGTFGANTGDVGDFTFPDDVVVNDDADVVGDLTAGTMASDANLDFVTKAVSTTALATPSALAATALNAFASTVSGATLMGFGTTHDVTLKNRAGTSVLGVTSNTSDVTAAGAITYGTIIVGDTARATPSALTTTAQRLFASTVSGGTLMGFGTTGDVTLKNRAGTDVLVVTSNTLNVTFAGDVAMTGALSGVNSLAAGDASLGITGLAAAQGGAIVATGGTSSTAGNAGGAVSIVGGTPGSTGVGGAANVTAAAGGSASGKGGAANVTAGAGTAGDASGGSVILQPGAKNGSGLDGGTFNRGTFMFRKMPTPATATDTASLTDAQMVAGVIVATPTAAAAYTVRTGTQLLAALPTDIAADDAFDLTIINIGGTGDDITLTAATDITIVGDPVVRPSADSGTEEAGQGTFRFRYTGTTVFIAYRVA